jgi:2,3-bisphosphoglycerate-dependent phosphoglycerate mutase
MWSMVGCPAGCPRRGARALARELGGRRRHKGICAVFTSDLRRAVETAEFAFAGSDIPVLHDWRLRECDHGEPNREPVDQVKQRPQQHLNTPYAGGESWMQAVDRVAGFVRDLLARWHGHPVLVIGHVVTMWALDIQLRAASLADLAATGFDQQDGWAYDVAEAHLADPG